MNITVLYLSYIPYGKNHLKAFIDSYQKYNSGAPHNLTILFNGFSSESEANEFIVLINKSRLICNILFTKEKLDITSYFDAASKLNSEYVLFLNTYSVLLTENWCKIYLENILKTNVGVVGSTGALGDFSHDDDYYLRLKNFLKFKFSIVDIKKMVYYRFNYYPKVSPHIRTNAFMIKRELFLSLKYKKIRPFYLNYFKALNKSKLTSLCFEHGNFCLTNQLLSKGLKPIIVGKNGIGYELNQWKDSNSFWINKQENLIVSDNQTKKFDNADLENQKFMTYSAWGVK